MFGLLHQLFYYKMWTIIYRLFIFFILALTMPQVSKYKVSDKVLKKIYDLFFSVLGNQYDKEDFEGIIFELLTPTEKIMISKRITIIYLLLKQYDYKRISDVLKVSTATIAKFKLFIDQSQKVVPAINKMVRYDKFFKMIDRFFTEIIPPGTYSLNWTKEWQDQYELEKIKRKQI